MRKYLYGLMIALGGMILASCSMIKEDTEDCPKGLYVRFVYDYNIQRADMFKDHVGHVTLYVYDEAGNLVTQRAVSNTPEDAPLNKYGYAMHFNPSELKPGQYRLVAVGMQRDWEEACVDKGAKVRRPDDHSHSSQLILKLDHAEQADATTGCHHVAHENAPLDTLWHTLKVMAYEPMDGSRVPDLQSTSKPYSVYPLEEQFVIVTADRATYATVSLIRDTKHLNLTLHQIEDKADMHAEDYEVSIADDNCTLDHDNTVLSGHRLRYTPYSYWTSRFDSNGTTIEDGIVGGVPVAKKSRSTRADEDPDTERTAHFNLMTNRLMHYASDNDKNARLRIVNKKTGCLVGEINLPSMLQEGRIAYAINNYSAQEYLDREYDYHLQVFLKGDTWYYTNITIGVLGWSLRKDYQNL